MPDDNKQLIEQLREDADRASHRAAGHTKQGHAQAATDLKVKASDYRQAADLIESLEQKIAGLDKNLEAERKVAQLLEEENGLVAKVRAERAEAVLEALTSAADNARTACVQGAIGIAKGKADQEYVEMLEGAARELVAALQHAQEQVGEGQ